MSAANPEPGPLALGVDLGGTKIAAGLFDDRGSRIGDLAIAPTEAHRPAGETVATLFRVIDQAAAHLPNGRAISGIGIGSTGPLDPSTGTILEAETLPNLFHFPLTRTVAERFGLPVKITNDGNAFALAEALFGAARGHSIVVGVTLGTGCGCGIVIHGKILEGATANTGEVYRAPIAGRGFDEVLSGPGLETIYAELTTLKASGREISELARRGDAGATGAFSAFGRLLAEGLGTIAAVVDPSVIVLGGSVSASFELFAPSLREALPRYVAPQVARSLAILPATLGSSAGALGGAALFFSGDPIR